QPSPTKSTLLGKAVRVPIMMMQDTGQRFCFACGGTIGANHNFCSHCGQNLKRRRMGPSDLVKIGGASAFLFVFGWQAQRALAGQKPVLSYQEAVQGDAHQDPQSKGGEEKPDPELDALRKKANENPNEKNAWQQLSNALIA